MRGAFEETADDPEQKNNARPKVSEILSHRLLFHFWFLLARLL
jgi:hypothetical protein